MFIHGRNVYTVNYVLYMYVGIVNVYGLCGRSAKLRDVGTQHENNRMALTKPDTWQVVRDHSGELRGRRFVSAECQNTFCFVTHKARECVLSCCFRISGFSFWVSSSGLRGSGY